MTSNLLETDQALSELLEELTTLRSASQQLNAAGHIASDAISAAERVTELSDQVMQNSEAQLNSSAELATMTQERMADVIAEQKVFGEQMTALTESRLNEFSVEQKSFEERMTAMTQDGLNEFGVEQKSFEERITAMTQDGLAELSAGQKSYAEEMRQFIQSALHPQLAKYQRTANINRWLLIVTFLLVAANFGFVIWSIFSAG